MTDSTAPEQITINGQAYSPEDATQLIELGSKYKKMESDLNTSLDKVYPEYTRSQQELATLRKEKTERDAELEKFRQEQQAAKVKAETPETVQQARKAARELGLADEDYLKEKGYMTKDDMDHYFGEKQSQQKQIDTVLGTAKELEKEIDGSDGRVPFDQKAVLAYANAYGVADLKEAYDQMNERGNAKWKEAKLEAEARPGLKTLTPGGKREPVTPKYNNSNLGEALGEWLNGIPE